MSPAGRQAVLLGALAVSAALHLGVMAVISHRVMTRYTEAIRRTAARRPMAMREVKALPESVRLAAVKDLSPLRDSPEASSEALLPAASALEDGSSARDGVTPPVPADPERLVPPQPEVEVSPKFAEAIKVEDIPSFVTPVADVTMIGLTPPSAGVADAPLVVDDEPSEVPAFAPPPVVAPPAPEETAAIPADAPTSTEQKPDFAPPPEVMAEVDESVVAAEKAAVRDLLDVREAKELAKFVEVGANSAAAGKWTYFRVKIDPLEDLKVVPKDVVVLMDASGSIANDRLRSCRAAAKEILRTCTNTGDRFNLVAFRNSFSYAFKTWRPCDQPSFDAADAWMNRLAAHGRTDVFATIASVLTLPRDPKRPLIALVVTDGDANAGVSRTAEILSRFTALNDGLVSVYMYGVKEGANRELIDVLTHGNRGESFIYEGERKYAGKGIGELSERFRDPVLTDLRVVFTSGSNAEAFPRRLRNLYRGEGLSIVGRVPAGTREVAFSLKGLNGPRAYEGFFRVSLADVQFDPRLPGDWRDEKAIDDKLK